MRVVGGREGVANTAVFPRHRPIVSGEGVDGELGFAVTTERELRERVRDRLEDEHLEAVLGRTAFVGGFQTVITGFVCGQREVIGAGDVDVLERPLDVQVVGWIEATVENHFGAFLADDDVLTELRVTLLGGRNGERKLDCAAEVAEGHGEIILSESIELVFGKQAGHATGFGPLERIERALEGGVHREVGAFPVAQQVGAVGLEVAGRAHQGSGRGCAGLHRVARAVTAVVVREAHLIVAEATRRGEEGVELGGVREESCALAHAPSAAHGVHFALGRGGVDEATARGEVINGLRVRGGAVVDREAEVVHGGVGPGYEDDFHEVSEAHLDVGVGREDVKGGQDVAALVAVGIGHGHLEEVVATPTERVGGRHVDEEGAGVRRGVAPFELDGVEAVAHRRNGDVRDDLGHLLDVEDALSLAPVGVGHEDAVGTGDGPDGGVAQLGLRDDDLAAGIVPVAVPLIFDEGVHVFIADGDNGGVVATDRIGLDADVGEEIEALVNEEIL